LPVTSSWQLTSTSSSSWCRRCAIGAHTCGGASSSSGQTTTA
jgi:hypothetical protein